MAADVVSLGDQGVLIRFGDEISPALQRRVQAMMRALDRLSPPWLTESVPGYCSLLASYDDQLIAASEARRAIEAVVAEVDAGSPADGGASAEGAVGRLVEIPVWYDPEVAPDLEPVAQMLGLSVDELVGLHSAREYLVYVLGFRPGFPFMGVLDDRLTVPRLETPRPAVVPGSVAIAGRQTAIYPSKSPGGWRVLGRTPLPIFDAGRASPFALHPGDRVRFVPIDRAAFRAAFHADQPEDAHAVAAP